MMEKVERLLSASDKKYELRYKLLICLFVHQQRSKKKRSEKPAGCAAKKKVGCADNDGWPDPKLKRSTGIMNVQLAAERQERPICGAGFGPQA